MKRVCACTVLAFCGLQWTSARPVNAAVIPAATCEQPDVQAAVQSAQYADVVTVPAGQCTWTAPVTIERSGITVMGNGIDGTVISDQTAVEWNQNVFFIQGTEGGWFRLTGFTFLKDHSDSHGLIQIRGDWKDFRIHDIAFDFDVGSNAIVTRGYAYGVIDHCTFNNGRIVVAGDNDDAWMRPLTLGSANAVYVEDCQFERPAPDSGNIIDDGDGARYVFRYNTVVNSLVATHSACSSGGRGSFSVEVYENTIIGGPDNHWAGVSIRAGTGVIFNNTIDGYYVPIVVDNMRTCQTDQCHDPYQAPCDGTTWFDGNEDASGYPCIDQVGRSTDTGFGTQQSHEPMYVWDNTGDGAEVVMAVHPNSCPATYDQIHEDRDFYNYGPRPGYSPYEYPHPLTVATDSCGQLGGICCDSGQVCEGGGTAASIDCGDRCCLGGTCVAAGPDGGVDPDGAESDSANGNGGCGCAAVGASGRKAPPARVVMALLLCLLAARRRGRYATAPRARRWWWWRGRCPRW